MSSQQVDLVQRVAQIRAKAPAPATPPARQEAAEQRAEHRQQIGMMISEAGAGLSWHDQALHVLQQVAEQNRFVHTDLVRPLVPPTDNPRALGAVFTAAADRGWIRQGKPGAGWPPGAYVVLPSTASNGSGKTCWISNLHQQKADNYGRVPCS